MPAEIFHRRFWKRYCVEVANGLLQLCYPPMCVYCGYAAEGSPFCKPCRHQIESTAYDAACPRCAASVGPYSSGSPDCDLCRGQKYAFDEVVRLGRYDGELRHCCLRIKELSGYHLSHALAGLYWEHRASRLSLYEPQLVVPVPLHWTRRMRRGFNQVRPLAATLAHRLGIPLEEKLLARTRATSKQAQLAPTARKTNVRNAFRCRPVSGLKGTTVLLVDDILTTGSTCHQAARVLKHAGAETVIVAVFARGDHTRS